MIVNGENGKNHQKNRIFYGWYIVAGAWIIQCLNGGLFFNAFQLYFVHLRSEFNWTRSQVALAFSLSRAESGLLGPIQGWAVDKFGTRVILVIGTIIYAVGFFLLSRVQTLIQFYLSYIVISLGASLGGFITVNSALANWFNKKRAKAMGFAATGWGVSGLAVTPLVIILDLIGWRGTAFWSGVLVLVVAIPVSLMMRHAPEPHGYLPDGQIIDDNDDTEEKNAFLDEPYMSTREALKGGAFWFLSLGHASALVAVAGVNALFIPHLTENLSISAVTGASIFTLLTVVMVFAQGSIGVFGDRLNKRLLIVICMMGHTIALLFLTFAKSAGMVVIFAVLHGLSWGFRGPLMTSIRADYFGRGSFATIMGWSSLIIQIGTTTGPLIGAGIGDVVGTYSPAFGVFAGFTLLGAFFFAAAKPPDLTQNVSILQ